MELLEDKIAPASLAGIPLNVADINVVGTAEDPQLEAVIALGRQTLGTANFDLNTLVNPEDAECPILNLEVGPISLNLLGLNVDTSPICLDITATNDQGLLGGLLCDLSSGLDLGGILDQLEGSVDTLLNRLDRLLDRVLGRAMTATTVFGTDLDGGGSSPGTGDVCDILNLQLGPIDLSVPLLGVNVHLDDCNDGPVTVDITADPAGGILGDLLCGLAEGLDLDDLDLGDLVDNLDDLLDNLIVLANRLDRLDEVGGSDSRRVEQLLNKLERLADRADDLRDLDRFARELDKTVDRIADIIDRLT